MKEEKSYYKLSVHYRAGGNGSEVSAEVTVSLPARDGWLHPLFVSPRVKLLGQGLVADWGEPDSPLYRRRSVVVSSSSVADLTRKVAELQSQIRDIISAVVAENRAAPELPEDASFYVEV